MPGWICALELNGERSVVAGSAEALCAAIRHGADLRIQTEFRHNEHIDTSSDNPELIQEAAEFRVTYLLEDRWTAGIMTLRQPIALPDCFGPRSSMSFFLYNQDGRQAIARPHLDSGPLTGAPGPSPLREAGDMPKYHQLDNWDALTNAPSGNFVYDFEYYRYMVNDRWREVLAHAADGTALSGSLAELTDAFARGREIKVAVRGICADLIAAPGDAIAHELFVQIGSCYYYTERRLFIAATQPVVRVRPAIPLRYASRNWDFGWLMARTDGLVARLFYDPYSLRYSRGKGRYALRWFVGAEAVSVARVNEAGGTARGEGGRLSNSMLED